MKKMDELLAGRTAPKKAAKGIHSEMHELADQISQFYGEPQRFATWLGVIKRNGIHAVHVAWGSVKDSNVDNPARLLMWKLSKKAREKKPESQA